MDQNLRQYFAQKDEYDKSLSIFMEAKEKYEKAAVEVEQKKAMLDRVSEIAKQSMQQRVSKLNADLRGNSALSVKLDGLSPILVEQKRTDAGVEESTLWKFKVENGSFCLDAKECTYSQTPGVMEILFRMYPGILAQLNN